MGPVTNNPFLIAIINMIVVFGIDRTRLSDACNRND